MQISSLVSVLTVIDIYLSFLDIAPRFSCYCWRQWITPIKGIFQNLWAETTSCSIRSQWIKLCFCFATISNAYRLWASTIVGVTEIVTLYMWINLCVVFSFSCLSQPWGECGLRLKQSWWTWDQAASRNCHHTNQLFQNPKLLWK